MLLYFNVTESVFDGCWKEVLFDMKIQVERCGCNSASKNMIQFSTVVFIATMLSLYLYF